VLHPQGPGEAALNRVEVIAVARSEAHRFSKTTESSIALTAGLGVEGDCHAGVTVKHRSRVARDPSQPNLRQVHLIHAELHDALAAQGLLVAPGEMGENITTRGIELLALPTGARLRIGASAIIAVTGLRNPCSQLNAFRPGLMEAVLARGSDGGLIRKAGVMGVVVVGGVVQAGDHIAVDLPDGVHRRLEPV